MLHVCLRLLKARVWKEVGLVLRLQTEHLPPASLNTFFSVIVRSRHDSAAPWYRLGHSATESATEVALIPAFLSHRDGERWVHIPDRAVHRLEDNEIRLPKRDARVGIAIHVSEMPTLRQRAPFLIECSWRLV